MHKRRGTKEVGKIGTMLTSIKSIRFKYLGSWLKHQLSQPHWFHNLFVNRMAWGAFSIYAHQKRSNGKPKISFSTQHKAERSAADMSKKYGSTFVAYKCLFCDGWHVSKVVSIENASAPSMEEIALEKYAVNVSVTPAELDVERILATNIPDLAPVYGGFRGRTLSSTRQLYAWKSMLESGIDQVIDLRADYTSDFYSDLCKKSGIAYFHYPVAYDEESIAEMVKLFPELCRLIDRGRFYIACAMGLHRTDIALCTYWMFYAADKGITPPPIRGYRRDKGMNTNKIMRILNAIYKYRTIHEGVEPMSEEVFVERKNVINELSKI